MLAASWILAGGIVGSWILGGWGSSAMACDAILGEAYSEPPEYARLELDSDAWHVASRVRDLTRARKQWVTRVESLRGWTELVSWEATFRSGSWPLARVRDRFIERLRERCPSLRMRERSSGEQSLSFEWSDDGCYGRPPQHEIVRLVAGEIGTHQLSFARRGSRISEAELSSWEQRLARVVLAGPLASQPSAGQLSEAQRDVLRARRLFWRGQDAAARDILLPLAESGLASAQEELAGLYYQQWNVPEALRWFRAAAAQNHPQALYHLGRMVAAGQGLPAPDPVESRRLYERAGQLGEVEAQLELGELARSADPPRLPEARRWFAEAAAAGSIEASYELAELDDRVSTETAGDVEARAKVCAAYRRAAVAGLSDAQFALGRCHATGEGVPLDDTLARMWLMRSVMQGNDAARTYYFDRYPRVSSPSARAAENS